MAERETNDPYDDPNNPYRQTYQNVLGGPGDGYGDPYDGIGSPESGYGVGGVQNPAYQQPFEPAPWNYDPYADYNGGSPVNAPLDPGKGWEWTANQRWEQVAGRGLGYTPQASGGGGQPQFQPAAQMGGGGGGQAPAPSLQKPAITDEVTKLLMARMNELKNPQDLAGDPNYQNAVRAYQVQSLRGAERQRKALAERAAAGGTRSSGGFNVGVRGILERQGENAAQYSSGLALDRASQREQQLLEAIRIARAIGQDDMANQLELQRLALQQELGRGDLALRGELGRGQLGLGYDQLGLSYADLVMRANRDATLAGLGG